MTGSGKTTTLAAVLETINQLRPVKIVTIEDPIEFLFEEKLADIAQREVGVDCPSFHVGARDAWRQNPDVISIAEIRDQETAIVALQAAETGHLVFGTLHASNVRETPERLLKLLPADMRERARDVFASVLVGLFSQVLLPKRESGRIALREILLNDDAITAVHQKRERPRTGPLYAFGPIQRNDRSQNAPSDAALAGRAARIRALDAVTYGLRLATSLPRTRPWLVLPCCP